MNRFDVAELDKRLVVIIQSQLLQATATRVVILLVPRKKIGAHVTHLNPIFSISDTDYILQTQVMATVALSQLKPTGHSLARHSDEIIAAIDLLFSGF